MASSKAVEAAKTWLRENNSSFHSTANFASFTKEGENLISLLGQACHAPFNRIDGTIEVIATELDTKGRRAKVTAVEQALNHEHLRPFINWLVNDSIYAPCIVTKDVDEIIEMSGIVVSLAFPSQMVMSALVIARYPYEIWPKAFENFCDFLSKGYNACVSAYICFNTMYKSGNDQSIFDSIQGHTALSGITYEALKRMVAKEPGQLIKQAPQTCHKFGERTIYGTVAYYYDEGSITSYNDVHTRRWFIFTKQLITEDKDLQSIIKQSRGLGDMDAYRPPNPFSPAGYVKPPEPWQITCKELREVVLPYMKEKGII